MNKISLEQESQKKIEEGVYRITTSKAVSFEELEELKEAEDGRVQLANCDNQ